MCCQKTFSKSVNGNEAYEVDNIVAQDNLQYVYTYKHQLEDFVLFAIAVILFCMGVCICLINAYCIGKCISRVESSATNGLSHFSHCTYY